MAEDAGQGLEEVTESEMSFHHERPDSRLYRQNLTTNDTDDAKDLFTPPLGKKKQHTQPIIRSWNASYSPSEGMQCAKLI